jgi:hypothetical protein
MSKWLFMLIPLQVMAGIDSQMQRAPHPSTLGCMENRVPIAEQLRLRISLICNTQYKLKIIDYYTINIANTQDSQYSFYWTPSVCSRGRHVLEALSHSLNSLTG